MNGIDQCGHRIIRRTRIFRGLMGCQPNPQVGASQKTSLAMTIIIKRSCVLVVHLKAYKTYFTRRFISLWNDDFSPPELAI